jgi:hypothetical protein
VTKAKSMMAADKWGNFMGGLLRGSVGNLRHTGVKIRDCSSSPV